MRIQFAIILFGVIALDEGGRADNFAMARGILQVERKLTADDNYNEDMGNRKLWMKRIPQCSPRKNGLQEIGQTRD
jgi:hypothetical protein